MRYSLRLTVGLTALALVSACADSPVAPGDAVAPVSGSGGRQASTTTSFEYDWTFQNQAVAIFYGKDMLKEPRVDETVIVPGDVKWLEWQFTAARTPAADVPGLTKDAQAKLDMALIKPCTDMFPLLICTWGNPGLAPWTISEYTQFLMMVDVFNFEFCGMEIPFTNKATLTELGPYPSGTKPQVHLDAETIRIKTGVCPPKPADLGCTLTQGYWKNHVWPVHPLFPPQTIDQWAADNDWTFFDTGKDWKEILNVAPRGDAYYILAHQYIAAILNAYNGAYLPPEVQETIGKAYLWFSDASVRASTPRETVIGWASLLDSYNNGKLGVSHCDDGGKNKGKKS